MNRILFFIAFSFIFQFGTYAQDAINNYKYIIVPTQYDFQKSEDQYQLNSLTKFLFNKHGYQAYLQSDEFPSDLGADNCMALKAILKDVKGGFLVTKIQIDLVDCKNNTVATSVIGITKIKNYKKAYTKATRDAFITYQDFDYKYNGSSESKTTNVEAVKEKAAETKVDSKETLEVVESEIKAADEKVKIPDEIEIIEEEEEPVITSEVVDKKDILYAQPIDNGFQIVDTEPKKVMMLLYSGSPDMYIVQGKDAVVYRNESGWVYAENDGNRLRVKKINLKF
ncbi:hypothetical protein [uncultured Psychroserpens sp.]|uniref:hypothetical protein n=1 Tax=uncultured Psychroserpens sp. TaxID=255436 RepID=UPI002609319D|nr:hypothetical protein [uncultured Psychroserpens sp.]